jgi:hypothetical protein
MRNRFLASSFCCKWRSVSCAIPTRIYSCVWLSKMIFALESGAGNSQNGTLGLHCLSEMRDSIKTFVAKILRILGPKSLDFFFWCVCVKVLGLLIILVRTWKIYSETKYIRYSKIIRLQVFEVWTASSSYAVVQCTSGYATSCIFANARNGRKMPVTNCRPACSRHSWAGTKDSCWR